MLLIAVELAEGLEDGILKVMQCFRANSSCEKPFGGYFFLEDADVDLKGPTTCMNRMHDWRLIDVAAAMELQTVGEALDLLSALKAAAKNATIAHLGIAA